jgi:hypothetical protein
MKTRDQSRLASLLMLLAGIWLVVSPIWISVGGGALASLIITGLVVIVASVVQYFWANIIPSWVMGLAALWLVVSAITYGVGAAAAWSQIISAVVVAILAYWDGVEITHLQHGNRHRPATPAM